MICDGVVLPDGLCPCDAQQIASMLKDYQDDVGCMAGKSDIEAAVMVFLTVDGFGKGNRRSPRNAG